MNLITRQHISPRHSAYAECLRLCVASKMLRNVALYHIRQFYFEFEQLFFPKIGYPVKKPKKQDRTDAEDTCKKKKHLTKAEKQALGYDVKLINQYVFDHTHLYHELKNHECFRTETHPELKKRINTKVMKQIFIQVNREFSGFFSSIKSYWKNPEKQTGKPRLPNYSKKVFQTRFPKDALSFPSEKERKENPDAHYVQLSMTDLKVPLPRHIRKKDVLEVLIVPVGFGFDLIVNYKRNTKDVFEESQKNNKEKIENPETLRFSKENEIKDINTVSSIAGCDIGLNNLMALASNDLNKPHWLVNGRPLKSVNQYYNKKKAQLTSELPQGIFTSKAIQKLTTKRNHKIHSLCHEATRKVVDTLIKNNIECLVVGNNQGWKQEITLGKKNNQNFVSIPFAKIRKQLKYKCELAGILYLETEERYTSKCSFADQEILAHHTTYAGKRVARGLFKTKNGMCVNADTHGALNIIRKIFGFDVFSQPVSHYIKRPIKILHNHASKPSIVT